jgi:hypothetical protein
METFSDYLKDKNIIIVGPSQHVYDDCKEIDVNSYDVIVRLNKHFKYKPGDHKIVGKRTDVLYHCLNQDQINLEDLKLIKSNNIRLITRNEINEKNIKNPKIGNFISLNKKVNLDYDCIPYDFFKDLKTKLKCNPSTGVLTIMHLLSFEIKSLTVVGFDFYETLYFNKKDDKFLKTIQTNKVAGHNPKSQLAFIKDVYKNDERFKAVGRLKTILES